MNQPLVSIITSCYNHEKYLDDYFEGLLAQTYPNIELIFFDDGSTDSSWQKVCNYEAVLKKKFPKIVLEQQQNVGFFKELAGALKLSSGKYVAILESDDYLLSQKTEKNVKFLESHPDFGMVHSDIHHIYNSHIVENYWQKTQKNIPQGNVFEELLTQSCFIRTCAAFYRADLFKKYVNFNEFETRGYLTGDTATWLSLAKHTQFGYINEALACYRIVPGSLSRPGNVKTLYEFWLNSNQITKDFVCQYGISPQARMKMEKRYHEASLFFSQKLFLKKELSDSCDWLSQNDPIEYKKISMKLIRMVSHNQIALNALRFFIDLKVFASSLMGQRIDLRDSF